jgi:hypothetical protein
LGSVAGVGGVGGCWAAINRQTIAAAITKRVSNLMASLNNTLFSSRLFARCAAI